MKSNGIASGKEVTALVKAQIEEMRKLKGRSKQFQVKLNRERKNLGWKIEIDLIDISSR